MKEPSGSFALPALIGVLRFIYVIPFPDESVCTMGDKGAA
jgi:hypothetical protein